LEIKMNLRKISILLVLCLLPIGLQFKGDDVQATTGTVVGIVFNDKNSNGTNDGTDAGVSGVVVTAYDSSGAQVGTATTSGNGTYSLNVSSAATNNVRIEFTTPNGYQPSFQGADNATSIQFVSIPATNVNYAVLVPENFCQDNIGSSVAAICMRPGTTTLTTSKDLSSISATSWKGTSPSLITKNADTGSLWGMAFDAQRQVIFASATLRRHSGLGPKGIAGIYATSRESGSVIASWDLSQTPFNLTFSADNSAFSDVNRGLDNSSILSADAVGYANVGKVGIGDIDMSPDGQWIFVSNLYEKKIHRIAVSDTNSDGVPELGAVTSYTIPANTCPNTSSRPWGLTYNNLDDSLLIGVVCSKESQAPTLDTGAGTTSLPDPGVILKLTLSSSTFTTLSSVDFDYVRSVEIDLDAGSNNAGETCMTANPAESVPTGIACLRGRWHSWTDNFATIETLPGNNYGGEFVYNHPTDGQLTFVQRMWWPQPIIADIELLPSGQIVLGVMDRFGMQMGTNNRKPTYDAAVGSTHGLVTGYVAGDTLLLCPSGGSYIQNNADGCTPATADDPYMLSRAGLGGRQAHREVFDDNLNTGGHLEMTIGGLAYNSTTKELAVSMMDPSNTFFTGGIRYLKGDHSSAEFGQYESGVIFTGSTDTNSNQGWNSSFLKSTSMGDIELLCDQAPVQIGNRVWIDTNQNGIQDPGEPPVAGVYVMLYDATGPTGYTNQVGTAITNANGEYFFSSNNTEGWWEGTDHLGGGLVMGRSYRIRMDWPSTYTGSSALAGHVLTQANATSAATALDTSVDNNATYVSSFPEITVPTVTSGMNNHTYDFGFIQPKVSVGNFVWIDSDADGIQDQGEPGLAGAVLTLTNMSGNPVTNVLGQVVGSQTTTSNGAYLFENLPPGQYKVNITYPAGYQATTASAGSDLAVDSSTDTATSVNLPNNGDADLTLDFGVVVTPSTTTTTTTSSTTSTTTSTSTSTSTSTTTSSTTSTTTAPSTTTSPTPVTTTASSSTTEPTPIPNVSPEGSSKRPGYPGNFNGGSGSGSGANNTPVWNGSDLAPTSEGVNVGGFVWIDSTKNGRQSSSERGISGVILVLVDENGNPARDIDGNTVMSTVTDSSGHYLFPRLAPGKYRVIIQDPSSYRSTISGAGQRAGDSSKGSAVSLNLSRNGDFDLTLDFGYVPTQNLPATGQEMYSLRIGLILLILGICFVLRRRLHFQHN
jgi:hypothetical protein